MQTWQIIGIIVIVVGFIWGNLALLRYSAKFDLTKFNQDPIEKAKASLAEQEKRQNAEKTAKKNEH
ncbi:DUF2897 family protein [Pseudoalteromonas tunicata]|nr:DUF2897 family protein [Pseudoalteromonas tunicata]ATC94217.1 hypothetical protein PTUN_a1610 [Pseudoalteromonas tunicata]AXT32585.1 DUF2897 family protein [Pseudoalteromonas tunicata]MDP4983027.1 DUF2897 family protein [Pseudoalteromonas tunicata]MDP5211445.1 DUF2897 family protein [Pseudoalteromonas tunicata]